MFWSWFTDQLFILDGDKRRVNETTVEVINCLPEELFDMGRTPLRPLPEVAEGEGEGVA